MVNIESSHDMLNEGIAQRNEQMDEFQKKIDEVMPSVMVLAAHAVTLQNLLSLPADL